MKSLHRSTTSCPRFNLKNTLSHSLTVWFNRLLSQKLQSRYNHEISCDIRLGSLRTDTYICWYEWQLRFLLLRQCRNLPDADGRNLRRRLENHFLMTLLFISCSSVSINTLISPITSKISVADGPTMDCG